MISAALASRARSSRSCLDAPLVVLEVGRGALPVREVGLRLLLLFLELLCQRHLVDWFSVSFSFGASASASGCWRRGGR